MLAEIEYQKYLHMDTETQKILENMYNEKLCSIFNTEDKRACWRFGYENSSMELGELMLPHTDTGLAYTYVWKMAEAPNLVSGSDMNGIYAILGILSKTYIREHIICECGGKING